MTRRNKKNKKKNKGLPLQWWNKSINPVTGWRTSKVNNQKGEGLPMYYIEKNK